MSNFSGSHHNRDTCFVLQKDFSKSPSKKAGLLTPKFPSGLKSASWLALQPVSANFPWDELDDAGRSPQSESFKAVTSHFGNH